MPKNAEKRLPIAGMCEMAVAWAVGTPWAVRPANKECGSDVASPSVMTVKKKPIESTLAEFWKVLSIAPPAPR